MAIAFVLTGYSNFPDCPTNPTETLVLRLEQELKQRVASGGVNVLVCKVLTVSAGFVDTWLNETATGQHVLPGQPTIWVHFGVDKTGDHFKLEAQAYNEATFREPDESGWQPQHEPIDTHPSCTPDTCLHTRLELPHIIDKLQALGHNVAISHSAGRYLCNYIYFRSLQLCSNVPNWHALFVHVPPLEVIGQDEEMAFAVDLFALLAQKVQATVPSAGLVTGRKGTLDLSAA